MMKVNWVQFGRDLKRAREDANLSLRGAAEQCGVHFAVLSRVERGKYSRLGTPFYLSLCRWMQADPFQYFKR